MAEQQAAEQFAIQRIYVKDISYESPNAPAIFRQWQIDLFAPTGKRCEREMPTLWRFLSGWVSLMRPQIIRIIRIS